MMRLPGIASGSTVGLTVGAVGIVSGAVGIVPGAVSVYF